MSKTERKWLKEVFIALSKFLKELAKILRETRLFIFREPKTKWEFWNKAIVVGLTIFPIIFYFIVILLGRG